MFLGALRIKVGMVNKYTREIRGVLFIENEVYIISYTRLFYSTFKLYKSDSKYKSLLNCKVKLSAFSERNMEMNKFFM